MATTIEAGRALTYNALRLFVDGQDAVKEVTMAKLATQRACLRRGRRVPPDPRRRRLHEGVRDRARRARHPPRPDRRRHRRDHEGDPRARRWGCRRRRPLLEIERDAEREDPQERGDEAEEPGWGDGHDRNEDRHPPEGGVKQAVAQDHQRRGEQPDEAPNDEREEEVAQHR